MPYNPFILSIASAQWALSALQFRLIVVSYLAMVKTCPKQTSCSCPSNRWFPASCSFRSDSSHPPEKIPLGSKMHPPNISYPGTILHLPTIDITIPEFLPYRIYCIQTFTFFSPPLIVTRKSFLPSKSFALSRQAHTSVHQVMFI